jgi:hypothetical protein
MSSNTVQNGKGSKRRPGDEGAYRDNWEEIFGKKESPIDTSDRGWVSIFSVEKNKWVLADWDDNLKMWVEKE